MLVKIHGVSLFEDHVEVLVELPSGSRMEIDADLADAKKFYVGREVELVLKPKPKRSP